ncbi:MAG: ParB/RepB/Spo0J family partition protein [Caldimonas sp.]
MRFSLEALEWAGEGSTGRPLMVSIDQLDEDPDNPRCEVGDADLQALADDICRHGILQPIVVRQSAQGGRFLIRFGARRLRAAKLAGLEEVPVIVDDRELDGYAQVAENIKRRALAALDLARFIQRRSEAGDSLATISKRLGVDQTTIAHHLALLSLPPVLDSALKTGRCQSPRTLYELAEVHKQRPEAIADLLAGPAPITRAAVASLRTSVSPGVARLESQQRSRSDPSLFKRTSDPLSSDVIVGQLEALIDRLKASISHEESRDGLRALRARLEILMSRCDI